ncbi:MAG: YqgE/AlgH family protein [Mariniblastus sp.]|nr:YqgE/AlgH family protein [Mariniblastus sp.]
MSNRFDNSELIQHNAPEGIPPGTLLIASPGLKNTPFEKAVVLVLQSGKQGTFGVVLNRPADEQMRSAWLQMTGDSAGEQRIVHGGPIGGPVFAIHQEEQFAEVEMPGGVFVTSDTEAVQELVRRPELDYRIVFGIAGWQRGRLTQEIEKGLWFPIVGDAEQVFDDSDWMWERSLKRYSRQMLRDVLGIRSIPEDPLQN